jgi:hypothetical protein
MSRCDPIVSAHCFRPIVSGVTNIVAQEKHLELLARTVLLLGDLETSAQQIPHGFILRIGHVDGLQFTGPIKPGQLIGITAISGRPKNRLSPKEVAPLKGDMQNEDRFPGFGADFGPRFWAVKESLMPLWSRAWHGQPIESGRGSIPPDAPKSQPGVPAEVRMVDVDRLCWGLRADNVEEVSHNARPRGQGQRFRTGQRVAGE